MFVECQNKIGSRIAGKDLVARRGRPPLVMGDTDGNLMRRVGLTIAGCSREIHWSGSILFGLAVIPLFIAAQLPLAVNWSRFFSIFWIGLATRALFTAALLFVIGFPLETTLKPMWLRYKGQPFRIVFFSLFAVAMFWEFRFQLGFMVIVDAIALSELTDRTEGYLPRIRKLVASTLIPALYLFFALVMVFSYNDLIAAIKSPAAYDWFFLKLDSYVVPFASVSQLAHLATTKFPISILNAAEFIYYGMFGQIGATLIILAIYSGKKQSLRYVGTVLTAYYIAIIIFFLLPSMGPFYTCPTHFAEFPKTLETYAIHQNAIMKARLLATHKELNRVDTDFFIAFPCLHIAQPLIVLWFLRRWKRIAFCLILFDLVLVPAILLLEWHYFVDVIAGVAVAALAIALNRGMDRTGRFRRETILTADYETEAAELSAV
jgi:hypothetical protein